MYEFVALDSIKREAAVALNDEPGSGGVMVDPRRIDNPEHPSAGLWALPTRIRDLDAYERWHAMIDAETSVEAEPSDLFLPPPEEE